MVSSLLSRDIFTALRHGEVCKAIKSVLVSYVRESCPDVQVIVGLEARGFLFSLLIAAELGIASVPIRKKGKLPGSCAQQEYVLEYGTVSCPFFHPHHQSFYNSSDCVMF